MSKLVQKINQITDFMQYAYMGKVMNLETGNYVPTDVKGNPLSRDQAADCVRGALQAFQAEPFAVRDAIIQRDTKKLQAFGVSTDFDILTKNNFNITIATDNFDLGYELAFMDMPLGTGNDSWDIVDVQDGLSFRKISEGGRIRVEGITGQLVSAGTDYYGGAIGFTDKMIRYRKVAAMVQLATIFRNRFWENKADNHYLLLSTAGALAANQITQQGAAADGVTRRNALTINEAAFQLGNRNKDKGYGNTAKTSLLIYANPRDEEAIEAAFMVTAESLVKARENGTAITGRQIKRIYTFNQYITAGSPLMVLPGQKIQKADAMMPTTFTAPIDPLTLNRLQSVWAIYGAAIGDTQQVVQFPISR